MEFVELLGFISALIIGSVLGLIGGGGSILTVPVLVYLLNINPVIATAYSLFIVGLSSVIGVVQKQRNGYVDFKTGLAFSFPSFIAVYTSRRFLLPAIPDRIIEIGDFIVTRDMAIMVFFAFVMIMASYSMISNKKKRKIIEKRQPYYKTFIQGLTIGAITGIIGAGGGFLYVPALVLWSGLSMKKAVGTSLVIVALNSLIGFIGDVENLHIDWIFLSLFTAISVSGMFIGTRLSKFIAGEKLKKYFGWFVLIMGIYIIYKEVF